MNKTQFTYQRWFLRVFYLFVIILLILLAEYEFVIPTRIPHESFGFDLVAILTCCVVAHFYFKLTKHCKHFISEGAYWVEDGIIIIETRRKTYSLNNVTVLYGTTISFLGYIKSGILKIDLGHKTLTLASRSTENIKHFSDSELYNLFETIVEYNTELIKDDTLEFLYKTKK